MADKYLKVSQTGSRIGRNKKQRAVLNGLGLMRMGNSRVLEDTVAVRGMIRKVEHLVTVEENVQPPADE